MRLRIFKQKQQNELRFLILIVGRSGSGKSSLAQYLSEHYGMKVLQSYTTRPKRYPDEQGHIFVTKQEADEIMIHERIVADTKFDGYLYFATQEQVDNADVYVIDPDGMMRLLNNYSGDKKLISFYINTDRETRKQRMEKRGDSEEMIAKRMAYDDRCFGGVLSVDWVLKGKKSTASIARTVIRILSFYSWLFNKVVKIA